MRLKQKLKSFFKTRDSSDSAVELMRMFIMPFMRYWDPNASLDEAVSAFFALSERKFYHATAQKAFAMPGMILTPGNRPRKKCPHRRVVLGQYLLLAVDRRDQTCRVDVTIDKKYLTFILSRAETEFLKDYVEIKEA